jgi:hypothetical protein
MSKCACGCISVVPNPSYENGGKQYASAFCLLRDIQCCSYCGGYYGEDFDPNKYEYKCRCNFSLLDS